MDYMPSEFADLVDRQRALAAEELGLVSSGQEGDFAGTLMELSALVSHVLGFYQDRYAREAFLGTAQSARSLVRHGRRLGYEPDPGLAATGHLLFTLHEGLAGTIARGFAVSSAPVGEKKAQDYETLDDVEVDHQHNELPVRERFEPYKLTYPNTRFEVMGVELGLKAGDVIVIESNDKKLSVHTLTAVEESADGATTRLTVDTGLPHDLIRPGFRLLARPASIVHLFGWDSSPLTYPEADLQQAKRYPLEAEEEKVDEARGYVVGEYADDDLYFSRELGRSVVGTPVVRLAGSALEAFRVESQVSKAVAFRRMSKVTVTSVGLDAENRPTTTTEKIPVRGEISGTVTTLRVRTGEGSFLKRSDQAIRESLWMLDFQLAVPLVHERLSTQSLTLQLALDGLFEELKPGQLLALSSFDPSVDDVEIAEITSVGSDVERTHSWISFRIVDPSTSGRAWTLGELRIRGNVARISHGKTVEEALGDSDGITPFLHFPLKNKPLTHLPGPDGAVPALEVRVAGVLWTLVEDFYESDAYDRHYLLRRDEAGSTFVCFGDGRHGAIPPAGRKHITARYRVGLGRDGNAEPERVDRIKKAHPLVERAHNPRPVSGGADPAGAEDVRSQATRFIRTFGRAVSVQDYADLALLFPGVARASAAAAPVGQLRAGRGAGRVGVRVIVADAEGQSPGPLGEIQKFLQARSDGVVPIEVAGPSTKELVLRLYLEVDRAFLPEAVQASVRDALYGNRPDAPGLFTFAGRQLGQPAFLSEVYARLSALPGVSFIQVTTFEPGPGGEVPRVLDVIQAAPGQWLRLTPEGFDFSLPAGVSP
ncbi:putative baseplate assembly protein [Cystobacter ferrugineus]|uniref:Putative baseplate assembly protein n=2 Tax=Cystobacter ferrugineus TaxID=83449 RepID=A0A1L9AX02_9BACT|nr:putative baseplate assembly protein [Cystobacter ferrugineus]